MLLRFLPTDSSAMNSDWTGDKAPTSGSFSGMSRSRIRGANEEEGGRGGNGSKFESGTVTKTRPKTKRPSLYRVLLLNDDYTPMEFVVLVLQDVFNKPRDEAMRIMLHVHQKGVGECGVFPFEVAETKVTRVMDTARKNQHPLQCVMEKQ
jgi:ATP-dependent Clp protease adaptor protein ClpS